MFGVTAACISCRLKNGHKTQPIRTCLSTRRSPNQSRLLGGSQSPVFPPPLTFQISTDLHSKQITTRLTGRQTKAVCHPSLRCLGGCITGAFWKTSQVFVMCCVGWGMRGGCWEFECADSSMAKKCFGFRVGEQTSGSVLSLPLWGFRLARDGVKKGTQRSQSSFVLLKVNKPAN